MNFSGHQHNFGLVASIAHEFPLKFADSEGKPFDMTLCSLSGFVCTPEQTEISFAIEPEMPDIVSLSIPPLPEGRWNYQINITTDNGETSRILHGIVNVLGGQTLEQTYNTTEPLTARTALVRLPSENSVPLRVTWLASTVAEYAVRQSLQSKTEVEALKTQTENLVSDFNATVSMQKNNAVADVNNAKSDALNLLSSKKTEAVNALNALVTSTEQSASEAEASAELASRAKSSVEQTHASVMVYAQSAEQAKTKAEQAKASAEQEAYNAYSHGSAARASAETASTKASEASASAELAESKADEAKESEESARLSAESASASATTVANYTFSKAETDARYGQLAGGNLWSGSNVFSVAPVVGVASGGTEAMSLQGWAYKKAKIDFKMLFCLNLCNSYKTPIREELWKTEVKTTNGNVLLLNTWVNNAVYDVILMQKAVAGSDYCYIDAGASPHTVTTYLGLPNYAHEKLLVHHWNLSYNIKDASVSIGGENYMHVAGDAPQVKNHAIHWTHQAKVVNPRVPRLHLENTATESSFHYNAFAYHLTIYGSQYLGCKKSTLLRASDYYCEDGNIKSIQKYAKFKWAMVPTAESLRFGVAPINRETSAETHYITKNVLLVHANNTAYRILDMHGAFNGDNAIRSYRLVMKRHKGLESGQYGVAFSFQGFEIYGQQGEASACRTLQRVVNELSEDYLPMPEVFADKVEIPAEGGQVVLSVAPTGHNANIYCLNDTMDGSGTFDVWCTQDTEELPSSGGQITLTVKANTSGADRLLWVFVGHHWAEATKVELVQKGE